MRYWFKSVTGKETYDLYSYDDDDDKFPHQD